MQEGTKAGSLPGPELLAEIQIPHFWAEREQDRSQVAIMRDQLDWLTQEVAGMPAKLQAANQPARDPWWKGGLRAHWDLVTICAVIALVIAAVFL